MAHSVVSQQLATRVFNQFATSSFSGMLVLLNNAGSTCACDDRGWTRRDQTRSSAIAEGPRDASCQLKSCQLPRNSAETTYTTSPDQIDGMKLEI